VHITQEYEISTGLIVVTSLFRKDYTDTVYRFVLNKTIGDCCNHLWREKQLLRKIIQCWEKSTLWHC